MTNTLAILDAGAQYGKVIDRRVRELGVRTEIIPLDSPTKQLEQYSAFIISGGPESVYGPSAPEYNPDIFKLGKPVLGICYGQQLINYVHGGTVEKKSVREDGQFEISVATDSLLFAGLTPKQHVLLTHGDSVEQVPSGFRIIARSGELVAGLEHPELKLYAVQFHPEVDLTVSGKQILSNFLFKIAGLKSDFTLEDREAKAIAELQDQIGQQNALVLLSGGVDSTVTAALLSKAIHKKQIYAVHIDHGFMRQDESRQVLISLKSLGLNIKLVDATETFARATTVVDGKQTQPLNQVVSPEEKRKIIGDTFVKVAEQAIADFHLESQTTVLVQGTLRPDLIESASKLASAKADTIKTHHNDSGLVRELRDQGRVAEPLSQYHKDEVRQLGLKLGLPEQLVWRQPFPGPGLAIRILCAQTPYLENYDQVYQQVAKYSTGSISVSLLPIQSVGVQGDGRTYSYVVVLSGEMNWPVLRHMALAIPKAVHQVNRVVYCFGDKLDQTIKEITPTLLTPEVVDKLRQADEIVSASLYHHDLVKTLTQIPVILLPLGFGEAGAHSVAIRTFITNDFMTGVPAVPKIDIAQSVVLKMVKDIEDKVVGVSRVLYDLTSKPPGTTEWE